MRKKAAFRLPFADGDSHYINGSEPRWTPGLDTWASFLGRQRAQPAIAPYVTRTSRRRRLVDHWSGTGASPFRKLDDRRTYDYGWRPNDRPRPDSDFSHGRRFSLGCTNHSPARRTADDRYGSYGSGARAENILVQKPMK